MPVYRVDSLTDAYRLAKQAVKNEWRQALTEQDRTLPVALSWIEAAVHREVRRLQRKHNEGRKWAPVPAATLRPGRRTLKEEGRPAR
ncbi:hypothetical protein [Arthrobacter sp. zg-Y1171]|uniref:ParB family protein n=1 Tax=Arthrobacter sp. zg-Y1171 TaxID=2964610 RepID=UPI00210348F6|nr:hypothetical protein [Arthrobacter sp. zg-Y1171]MCQ1994256.1 hypothetical protein [Arthrobacter sp. zg-Y1171]UWX81646.1 hypothetical protein N2L00_14860 [Arthrobacter sp. zg-Y1171]